MKRILLRCGKLFDGKHEELFDHIDILIEGNRIAEVGKNLPCTSDIQVLDLTGLTVTPGLIDNHIHSDFWEWKNRREEMFTTSDEWRTLSVLYSAQQSLLRGFTTVRHLNIGILGYGIVDVKRAINRGYFAASRLFVAAHRLGVSGGHADTSGYFKDNPRLSEQIRQPGIGTGADFFRDAVRKEIKYGTDLIKIMSTAGMFGPGYSPECCTPESDQLTEEEIHAILDTANAYGVPTTSHVFSPRQMIELAQAGISCIEHGCFMDGTAASVLEEKGVYLIPTFYANDEGIYLNPQELQKKSAYSRQRIADYHEKLVEGRRAIIDSNIELGYGTDIVSKFPAYESWHEYAAWLHAGVDPYRALKAATSVNAKILRQPGLGVIEPGRFADITAWRRDILTDPEAFSTCDFVMKDGKIYNQKFQGGQDND